LEQNMDKLNTISASKPVVALVGRTNVGKSTLFNLLARRQIAVVSELPHVTRDTVFATVHYRDREFLLVDTGGMGEESHNSLLSQVQLQAEFALREAHVLVMVVDAKEGVTASDHRIADALRKAGKPIILAANKSEGGKSEAQDFFELRLGEPLPISAKARLNISPLLQRLAALLPSYQPAPAGEALRLAISGHPNVGKSSLVNALLGYERMLVSEQPGTTRDAVDTELDFQGKPVVLIDTAGIRRKASFAHGLEYYSVLRAFGAIDRSDIALLVLDATEGVTHQDQRIAGYSLESGRAIICAVNKWDLIEKDSAAGKGSAGKAAGRGESLAQKDFLRIARQSLIFINYAPFVFCSALTGWGVDKIMPLAFDLLAEHSRRAATSIVNQAIQEAMTEHPPPSSGRRRLKIYYATQAEVSPPTFVVFANDPELMHFSYRRYLVNALRSSLGFKRCPLRLEVRASTGKERMTE
jgi:GTP-binding protein